MQAGQYEPSTALYQALCRQRGNTLTVVAEYYRKAPWGFLGSVLDAAVRASWGLVGTTYEGRNEGRRSR